MRICNKLKSYLLTLLLLTMCTQVFGSTVYTDPKHRYKIDLNCTRIEHWKQVYVETYFGKSRKQMDRILQSSIDPIVA